MNNHESLIVASLEATLSELLSVSIYVFPSSVHFKLGDNIVEILIVDLIIFIVMYFLNFKIQMLHCLNQIMFKKSNTLILLAASVCLFTPLQQLLLIIKNY